MQLLEKVKKTEFLGREFLVWLWFKIETGEGLFKINKKSPAELLFEGKHGLMVGVVANKFKTSSLDKPHRVSPKAVLRDARLMEILV